MMPSHSKARVSTTHAMRRFLRCTHGMGGRLALAASAVMTSSYIEYHLSTDLVQQTHRTPTTAQPHTAHRTPTTLHTPHTRTSLPAFYSKLNRTGFRQVQLDGRRRHWRNRRGYFRSVMLSVRRWSCPPPPSVIFLSLPHTSPSPVHHPNHLL